MARFIDPLHTNNFLDANIFDKIADGQDAAVREMLHIYEEEIVSLLLPYSVQEELDDPSTPAAVKKASQQFIYSVKVSLTDGEKLVYEEILAMMTGDSMLENIARDLFHVFEAQKNGGGHFVTFDKRLLKRGNEIAELLGVEVLTPERFVVKVRQALERMRRFDRRKKELGGST